MKALVIFIFAFLGVFNGGARANYAEIKTIDTFVNDPRYDSIYENGVCVDADKNPYYLIDQGPSANWIVREVVNNVFENVDLVENGAPFGCATNDYGDLFVVGLSNTDTDDHSFLIRRKASGGTFETVQELKMKGVQSAGFTLAADGDEVLAAGYVQDESSRRCLAFYSSDRGVSWTKIREYLPNNGVNCRYGGSFIRDGELFLFGSYTDTTTNMGMSLMERSKDKGASWENFAPEDNFDKRSHFQTKVDSKGAMYSAVLVTTAQGYRSYIYKSSDDGQTWTVMAIPYVDGADGNVCKGLGINSNGIYLSCWSSKNGVYAATILASHDEGATWEFVDVFSGESELGTVSQGLAVSEDGVVFESVRSKTADGLEVSLRSFAE